LPRIVVALPRGLSFGPARATSIDLCARDFVSFSRHRAQTVIVGEAIENPFPDMPFHGVPRSSLTPHWLYAARLARHIKSLRPDLVVVHQHIPSAVRIAKALRDVPILLHRHNGHKARRGAFARQRDLDAYGSFARILWVSAFNRDAFATAYPELAQRAVVIHNGIDFTAWRPEPVRREEVFFAARLMPQKGCLEAAQACAQALADQPHWRARFMLAREKADADYLAAVQQALAPLGSRAEILFNQTHDAVRAAYCSAAIALVPSVYAEPFGRTAIEAFAGGAALICSMRGGLGEIARGFAEEAAPEAIVIAAAITRLVNDPEYRADLARRGRARGETHFDIRAVTAKLDDTYDSVLAEHARSAA
jgi:glycosyltransferase involved in cell wall biosynthesis